MSQPTPQADQSTTTEPDSLIVQDQELVSAHLDSLIIGREIQFPIFNRAGVLLLAKGSVITTEFKQKLRDQDIGMVELHPEDAIAISSTNILQVEEEAPEPSVRDNSVNDKMKQAVEESLFYVSNHGPSALEQVQDHGAEAYQQNLVQEFELKNQDRTTQLKYMMDTLKNPEDVQGSGICQTIMEYIHDLYRDFDCTNSVVLNQTDGDSLSQHCLKMAVLGMSIGMEMGLNQDNICRIGVAGLLHDWGQLLLPKSIREANRPLNDQEQLELQKHPIYSMNLLERIKDLPSLVPLVAYQVHECMDGSGYPRGRSGENIHLFARILHLAHSYAELTTANLSHRALMPYAAVQTLLGPEMKGLHDPNVLRAFLRVQSLFPLGSVVTLSNGSIAKVIRANGDRYTEPVVQLIQDETGQPVDPKNHESMINLMESPFSIVQALPVTTREETVSKPHFLLKRQQQNQQQRTPTGKTEGTIAAPHIGRRRGPTIIRATQRRSR